MLHGLQQAVSGDEMETNTLKSPSFNSPSLYVRTLSQHLLDHFVGVGVGDLEGSGHVPGHMDHGNNRFDLLHFVPLEPLQSQLILVPCTHIVKNKADILAYLYLTTRRRSLTIERSNIPGDVVAPPHSLNPVDRTSVDPHQVSGPLDEAVHWDVSAVQILQHRPPGPGQVVHAMPEHKQVDLTDVLTLFYWK